MTTTTSKIADLNFFFKRKYFSWAISKKRPLIFCLWVVFWQDRMLKTHLAGVVISEWPKMASKSLL
jgi:hypothetical protein